MEAIESLQYGHTLPVEYDEVKVRHYYSNATRKFRKICLLEHSQRISDMDSVVFWVKFLSVFVFSCTPSDHFSFHPENYSEQGKHTFME